jgi:2-(1,2-epoxy-1,2-dihydrophenyl)acetyl-CoA isomerase
MSIAPRSAKSPLRLAKEGPVASITLMRPEAANTVNVPMAEAAALDVDEDEQVRLVVLTGKGKLFCGGGDVKGFAEWGTGGLPSSRRSPALFTSLSPVWPDEQASCHTGQRPRCGGRTQSHSAWRHCGGCAHRALHPRLHPIGLTREGGASWLLPRLVGLRRAQELVLTNRRLSADEATEMGFITRAVTIWS